MALDTFWHLEVTGMGRAKKLRFCFVLGRFRNFSIFQSSKRFPHLQIAGKRSGVLIMIKRWIAYCLSCHFREVWKACFPFSHCMDSF